MRIGILTGTRPDIIKMAPLYWEIHRRGHTPVLIHTGQHYSDHLFAGVYASMGLPKPHHTLPTGACASPAQSVGKMMLALDELLRGEEKKLEILLTHGDTLTAMSGSLAAYLNNVPVGHVEAGLRTFSREPFPEQLDTRCADAASDLYFAATPTNRENLLREGFPAERIEVVGNTVVDAARWAAKREAAEAEAFFGAQGVDFGRPVVYYSIHRRETTMDEGRFTAAARAAVEMAQKGYEVVWSIRPGTKEALRKYKLEKLLSADPHLHPIEEIPSYPFIMFLMSRCRFVCTDSGSMQEEAAALSIPCITVRFVTDRPESVQAGANVLAPPTSSAEILRVVEGVERNHAKMRKARNPYGEGDSAKRILDAILRWEGRLVSWEHQKKEKR